MRATLLALCPWMFAFVLTAWGDDAPAPVSPPPPPTQTPQASPSPSPQQTSTSPEPVPAIKMTLDLVDGSRIVGTPALDKIKVITLYSAPEIPLPLVRDVAFAGGDQRTARMNLGNGDVLNAKLELAEIAMQTSFGKVTIPLDKVRKIQVLAAGYHKSLPDGLVLYYSFNSDDGDGVKDESGAGNDGKAQGATRSDDGKIGGAMSFSGRQQAVIAKAADSLKMQDFTIMAWVKRSSATKVCFTWNQAAIFGYGQGGYSMGLNDDGQLWLDKIGSPGVTASCKIDDTNYHHMAVTKKGNKVVFYLDGTAYPADDFDTNFEFGTDVAVGARPDNLENTFYGLIDEVAVFGRVLSDDEVKQVFESQK